MQIVLRFLYSLVTKKRYQIKFQIYSYNSWFHFCSFATRKLYDCKTISFCWNEFKCPYEHLAIIVRLVLLIYDFITLLTEIVTAKFVLVGPWDAGSRLYLYHEGGDIKNTAIYMCFFAAHHDRRWDISSHFHRIYTAVVMPLRDWPAGHRVDDDDDHDDDDWCVTATFVHVVG